VGLAEPGLVVLAAFIGSDEGSAGKSGPSCSRVRAPLRLANRARLLERWRRHSGGAWLLHFQNWSIDKPWAPWQFEQHQKPSRLASACSPRQRPTRCRRCLPQLMATPFERRPGPFKAQTGLSTMASVPIPSCRRRRAVCQICRSILPACGINAIDDLGPAVRASSP